VGNSSTGVGEKLVATKYIASGCGALVSEQVTTMTRKCISAVGDDIHQTKPFASIEEELLVSLLRTGDVLHERFEQIIRPFNISLTQYNVLRILR
jgi:hypothetical protein